MDELDNIEITDKVKVLLQEEHSKLVKIIEAFEGLENSREWATLKDLVFDKSLALIEKQILGLSLAQKIDTDKLYKLQGEWAWAKQYNDVGRFTENLKKRLEQINKKIK